MADQPGMRASILEGAATLTGWPFVRIGQVWGALLGTEPVRPDVVALMMAGADLVSAAVMPGERETYEDAASLSAWAGELAQPLDEHRTATRQQADLIRHGVPVGEHNAEGETSS